MQEKSYRETWKWNVNFRLPVPTEKRGLEIPPERLHNLVKNYVSKSFRTIWRGHIS